MTDAGQRGADARARTEGIPAREILGRFTEALADGRIPPESADCIALDSTGIAALADNEWDPTRFTASLRRTLAPGGIAVVALGGDMVVMGMAERALRELPPEEFRYVGAHGDALRIIERTPVRPHAQA